MLTVRKACDRGRSNSDWLNSYHTFSFAEYHDPAWMGFGNVRVINEDYIAPDRGFAMHPHQDMEIITYVVSGVLTHQDSMGNGSQIKPGEIQRMSAGTGVRHSEFNRSTSESLHLLQIWILPQQKGMTPSYEKNKIDIKYNDLILIGSAHPTAQAVTIHQDIDLLVGHFEKDKTLTYPLHHQVAWLQLIKGKIHVNAHALHAGDGIGIREQAQLQIQCLEPAELLLFIMPF